jgi:hypothetical protein
MALFQEPLGSKILAKIKIYTISSPEQNYFPLFAMRYPVYLMSFISLGINKIHILHYVGQHLFLNSCGVHDGLWTNGKLIPGLRSKT